MDLNIVLNILENKFVFVEKFAEERVLKGRSNLADLALGRPREFLKGQALEVGRADLVLILGVHQVLLDRTGGRRVRLHRQQHLRQQRDRVDERVSTLLGGLAQDVVRPILLLFRRGRNSALEGLHVGRPV